MKVEVEFNDLYELLKAATSSDYSLMSNLRSLRISGLANPIDNLLEAMRTRFRDAGFDNLPDDYEAPHGR